MQHKKQSGFIPVDELKAQVADKGLETLLDYYNVTPLKPLRQVRDQIRTHCFLLCGRTEPTRDDALSICTSTPEMKWQCFHGECRQDNNRPRSGNLIGLCDLLKPGENHGGKPKGARFREIAKDLQTIAEDTARSTPVSAPEAPPDSSRMMRSCRPCSRPNPVDACFCHDCGEKLSEKPVPRPTAAPCVVVPANVPLTEHPEPNVRAMADLYRELMPPSRISEMTPAASRYLRMRPWLTDELTKQFQMGYLPRDSTCSLRDRIVYCFHNEQGRAITYFARDPAYETKLAEHAPSSRKKPPLKHRFYKGFQRGVELYGQHLFSGDRDSIRERLDGLGLPLVGGPNDVMRLYSLGLPYSLALCSPDYRITREQAERVATLAREVAGGIVWLLLPCTNKGEEGMRQCLGYLAQLIAVRLGWTSKMFGGRYQEKQVEQIEAGDLLQLEDFAQTGSKMWSFL